MVKMGREAQHILPKNWGVKVIKSYKNLLLKWKINGKRI